MTQQTSGGVPVGPAVHPTGPPTGAPTSAPTGDVAREQAGQVGQSAADAGRHVAETAAGQAGEVVQETRKQAADLLHLAQERATEQVRDGKKTAVQGLHTLATELHQMADGGDEHGPASDLAKQAAGRVEDAAGWLDRHEPGDLMTEVRRLARRRPGGFLLGALVAGVAVGRLTRGAVDANRKSNEPGEAATLPAMQPVAGGTPPAYAPPTPHAAPTPYPSPAPMPYEPAGGPAYPSPGPLDQPGVLPPAVPSDTPVVPRSTVGEYVDGRDRGPRTTGGLQ